MTREDEANNQNITKEELDNARLVLPQEQYNYLLNQAQGEEKSYFISALKDISKAVVNAPKPYSTDGSEQHPLVIHYFSGGTDIYVCEIDKDEESYFGYTILNGDFENAEWGYGSLDEVRHISSMDLDLDINPEMTIERKLYHDYPEHYPEYEKLSEEKNISKELQNNIAGVVESINTSSDGKNLNCQEEDIVKIFNQLDNDKDLQESASNNTLQDFGNSISDILKDILVEGYQSNKDLYKTILNSDEIMQNLSNILRDEIYSKYNEKEKQIPSAANYSFFVKSTAEFEQFATFKAVNNLSAEEAVELFQTKKTGTAGIGINIPNDFIFDDKNGDGITVAVPDEDGKVDFKIFGDTFIDQLNENNTHSENVIDAYKELYYQLFTQGVDVAKPDFLFEKEAELKGEPYKTVVGKIKSYEENEKSATDFVLGKLKAAGIEVVQDKEQFENILKENSILQKSETIDSKGKSLNSKEDLEEQNRIKKELSAGNLNNQTHIATKLHEKYTLDEQKKQEVFSNLCNLEKELNNAQTGIIDAQKCLSDIKTAFGFNSNTSSDYVLQKYEDTDLRLRVSDHNVNPRYSKSNEKTTSLVIKLSHSRFRNINKSELIEYVYNGKDLTKEKMLGIISGLKDWTEKGEYTDNHFDKKYITTKEEIINKNIKKLMVQSGTVYGFAYEGKIYLNPDTINSNAAVHEYTHLWDNYTRQTNQKLWNKGKELLSKTHLWNEVKSDPNYADIAQNDDLVLSECHARICGNIAQKVLESIAEKDGEIAKDKIIDWDQETWKYVVQEFTGILLNSKVDAREIKDFIAMPMQDLMSGRNITIDEMNLQQAPEKKNNMSFEKGIDMFVALNKKTVQIEAGTKFNFEADGMKYINADYQGFGEVSGFIAFNIDGEIKNIPYGQIKNITLTEEPARAIEKTEAESFAQKVKNDDFLRDHIVISGVPRAQNEIHIKPSVQDRNTGKAWGVNPDTGKMEELKSTENGWVLDESKKNMHPSIDNHDKTSHYNIEESLTKQGAENEGKESSAVQVREGDDDRTQDGRGNNGRDVEQHDNRLSPEMGGAGSGLNGGGTGHGDSVQTVKEAVGREDLRHAPDDNSPSGGSIQSAGENHDTAGGGLHGGSMQQGALGDDILQSSSGADTTGYGDVGRTQGLKGQRELRAEVKNLLEAKSDKELTKEDVELLKMYEGGGGLKEQDSTSAEALNAFYTPRNLIQKVWQIADHYSPDAVTVLEPSSGIGRFAEGRANNKFTLRELDETSARIAKILHPDADVIQGAFQKQFFDENEIAVNKNYVLPKYDMVIGNPPYGEYSGKWKGLGEGKEFDRIEEYFLDKGLESLKPCGSDLNKNNSILAMVLPSGFLNSSLDKQKNIISEKGFLLDAYRLPEKVFPSTQVGTDIVIMKRYGTVNGKPATEEMQRQYAELLSNNNFFTKHPEKVLGQTKTRMNRFGRIESYVTCHEGMSVDDELNKIDSFAAPLVNKKIIEQSEELKNRNVLKEQIKSTAIDTEQKKPALSNVQRAYNSIFKKEEITFVDNSFYKACEIDGCLGDLSKEDITTRAWRNGERYSTRFILDVETRSIAITMDTENGKKLLETIDSNGRVRHFYKEESASQLTKARKQRLNEITSYYLDKEKQLLKEFVGVTKSGDLILRNQKYLSTYSPYDSFYNSKSKQMFSPEMAYGVYNSNLNHQEKYSKYGAGLLFPLFSTAYPEKGKADVEQILEDDKMTSLAANPDDDSEKQNTDMALEMAKRSGFSTIEEYEQKSEEYINNIEAKWNNDLRQRHSEAEKMLNDYSDDIMYDKILAAGFKADGREYTAGSSIVKTVPGEYGASVVMIDGEAAFSVDEAKKSLATYSNYPVTDKFVKSLYEKFGGTLNVSDTVYHEDRLSLDKMISAQKVSEKKAETARKASSSIAEHIGSNAGSKDFSVDGESFDLQQMGTHYLLYIGKDKNYAAFDFDRKTSSLEMYQPVFDSGCLKEFELAFRSRYNGITVKKDIVIDSKRYVDKDGVTTLEPPKPAQYKPEEMKLMNNKQFSDLYGQKVDDKEKPIWAATNWEGYVDLKKLLPQDIEYLRSSGSYMQETDGKYIHKELFASGNIYEKISRNEDNYLKGLLDKDSYERNKKALNEAVPKPFALKDMNLSPISDFARDTDIGGTPLTEKFMQWATGCVIEDSGNLRNEITDFTVAQISRDDIPPTISWGDIADYIDGVSLPPIRDDEKEKAKKTQIRNQKLNDRREAADKLFNRFIQTSLTEGEEKILLGKYNRTFNADRAPDYSKLPLFISGMNQFHNGRSFKLYEQQIKGISFLCNKGNGLLAYDVGVGKTAAGIAATVNQIQTGRSDRPVVVVPKSVLAKWENDFKELFPGQPIINLGNLSISNPEVQKYYDGDHGLKIPSGAITLITKDALNNISFSKNEIDDYLFKDYADLLSLNESLESEDPKERAVAREKIYQNAGCAGQVKSNDYILWNRTRFDHITVDEAHAYKNLFKVPRPKKGKSNEFSAMGTGTPSKRALKMFNITQLIQQKNNDRNVFMLTATPFTNSPLEVYSMLTYVARKELEKQGIKDLYSFCSQYAKTRFEQVVTAGNDVKYKTVMKEFGDLRGLQNTLRQFIDKVDGEEAGIIRPEKRTHAVYLEPTQVQKSMFSFAADEVMNYRPDKEAGEKGAPVLEAMNLMRTAALSPALVKEETIAALEGKTKKSSGIVVPPLSEVVESSPKLKLVCDTVVENWKSDHTAGQVIYMPEGTEAYPYVIDYMVKKGIPSYVFASIDGSNAMMGGKPVKIGRDEEQDDKRAKVADCFNDKNNACKILIGSSAISEGMDLNGNSTTLYNCMLGWNPSESVQVEGRIWRQGNEQGRVHIVYPLVEDSIDSLLYQKHDEKKHRTDSLFSYKGSSLNVEQIDPEKMKFDLIKDPEKRAAIDISGEKADKEQKLLMLENQVKEYDQLGESRKKYKELLEQREDDKKEYVERYKQSVFEGDARRTEEEQKTGEARYDKTINNLKTQLANINRKYIAIGIENSDDEHNFAVKIAEQKKAISDEIAKIESKEHLMEVKEKYDVKLENEHRERLERRLTNPLHKTIQGDLVPFYIVEYKVKQGRFDKAYGKAVEDKDMKLAESLQKEWNEYKDEWNKDHNPEKSAEVEKPKEKEPVVQKPAVYNNIQEPAADENQSENKDVNNVAEKQNLVSVNKISIPELVFNDCSIGVNPIKIEEKNGNLDIKFEFGSHEGKYGFGIDIARKKAWARFASGIAMRDCIYNTLDEAVLEAEKYTRKWCKNSKDCELLLEKIEEQLGIKNKEPQQLSLFGEEEPALKKKNITRNIEVNANSKEKVEASLVNKPLSLAELLNAVDFEYEIKDGKINLIDKQDAYLGDPESYEGFSTTRDIVERLENYFSDYEIKGIDDTLEEHGILTANMTWADRLDVIKKNSLEKEIPTDILEVLVDPEKIENPLLLLNNSKSQEKVFETQSHKEESKSQSVKMPDISITKEVKLNTSYPAFDILQNKEKDRINIKFDASKKNPNFTEIIGELKRNGWRFAPSTRCWYPIGNAVAESKTFADELLKKYSSDYSPDSSHEEARQKTGSAYDGVNFFDRDCNEANEFLKYYNSAATSKISISQAKTILKSLDQFSCVYPKTSRNNRLGVDSNNNLVMVSNIDGALKREMLSLDQLVSLAYSKAMENYESMKQNTPDHNCNSDIAPALGNLFDSISSTQTQTTEEMSEFYKIYQNEKEKHVEKTDDLKELENGGKIGDRIASNVLKLSKGVYQATLVMDEDIFSGANYFILDRSIAELCSKDILSFIKNYGERFVVDDKNKEPYVLKELIDKKLCPPRDKEYYQKLCDYTSKHPVKYASLLPNTVYNFKENLMLISKIDIEDKDIFSLGKKLISMSDSDNKPKISEWLKKEGCLNEASMRRTFESWCQRDVCQDKDKLIDNKNLRGDE